MGQEADQIDGNEIKEGNVPADQQHGNDDHECGIPELQTVLETATLPIELLA